SRAPRARGPPPRSSSPTSPASPPGESAATARGGSDQVVVHHGEDVAGGEVIRLRGGAAPQQRVETGGVRGPHRPPLLEQPAAVLVLPLVRPSPCRAGAEERLVGDGIGGGEERLVVRVDEEGPPRRGGHLARLSPTALPELEPALPLLHPGSRA